MSGEIPNARVAYLRLVTTNGDKEIQGLADTLGGEVTRNIPSP